MIVQIYEVSNPTGARKLAEIGVDHIGVLVGKGKYPRELPIEKAREIFQSLPPTSKEVVLSLSDDLEEISEIVETVKIPVILAGGLGADNVAEAIRKVKPAGVDSKTKTDEPNGHEKDIEKVKEFVRIAKSF